MLYQHLVLLLHLVLRRTLVGELIKSPAVAAAAVAAAAAAVAVAAVGFIVEEIGIHFLVPFEVFFTFSIK